MNQSLFARPANSLADSIKKVLTTQFGYTENNIRVLRDKPGEENPTKANIENAIRWLAAGAKPGDHLTFHYSGHGGQMADTSGDEADGYDGSSQSAARSSFADVISQRRSFLWITPQQE